MLGGLPQPVSRQSSEQQATSRPSSTSAPAASQPRPAVTRPPPQPALPTNWKLSSILVRGNQVGDYLKGLTETSATLSKEAVLVNDSNKVCIVLRHNNLLIASVVFATTEQSSQVT